MRSRGSLPPFVGVPSARSTAPRPARRRPRLQRHRFRFRGRRRVLIAVLASGVLLVPLAEPALAADTVHYEPRPEGVRVSPGETEQVFFRANDAVTYRYCDDDIGTCVTQSVTCAAASEDLRTMMESAEEAWLVLTLQGHWKLRRQRPFDLADLLQLLKPVLPLRYYFLNPEIEFADPSNREGGFGDTATHRDPDISTLLDELYEDPDPADSGTDLIDDISTIGDLYLTSSDPNADPQSIADALPPDLRSDLDLYLDDPVNNPVPPGTLDEIKQALRVDLAESEALEATLSYLNANIVNTGWLSPAKYSYQYYRHDRLEEIPYTLVYLAGHLLAGLLDLLGLPGFAPQHVVDMQLRNRLGQMVKTIPAARAVFPLAERCRRALVLDNQSIQFVDDLAAKDGNSESTSRSDQVTAERTFGSIRSIDGLSSEKAHHVLGGSLWKSLQPLIQDEDHIYRRGPWGTFPGYPLKLTGGGTYNLNRSHGVLKYDSVNNKWQVFLRGTDFVLRPNGGDSMVEQKPNLMSTFLYHVTTSVSQPNRVPTEAKMGGTITLTAQELGIEVVRYCVGNLSSDQCEEWANMAVAVEPEGWDDARAMGVDDAFRLLVNRVSGRVALLQESADGDVTIDGITYKVLTRLCCLSNGDDYWSLDLQLPVMDNDRVVFFGGGHPLNKWGSEVLLDGLLGEDTVACPGSRYCTHIRPRPEGPVSVGDFGLTVSPRYTSLELTVSAPVENVNVTSERRVFDYCLAHHENTCGSFPPMCAKATYVESPRAPNAPDLVGVESSADLPATYFEATTLCAGMTGTVTLTVDVYDDPNPPDIPEPVWEAPPDEIQSGLGEELLCHDGYTGDWVPGGWRLRPWADAGRAAPSWCHLPPKGEVTGNPTWYCQFTRPSTYSLGKVAPAAESRWYSAMHVGSFSGGQWESFEQDRLYLVGQRLTEGAGEMCNDARTRIVGVWPTGSGVDNWILKGADKDQPCTEATGYDTYGEASCRASQGMLWQTQTGDLGDAWRAKLDAVKPCVGEAECDTWVPPVPGWYQVRIELDAPRTLLLFNYTWATDCRSAFSWGTLGWPPWDQRVGIDQTNVVRYGTRQDNLGYCDVRREVHVGPGPFDFAKRWFVAYSRAFRLVFDELIWVEQAYLGRG